MDCRFGHSIDLKSLFQLTQKWLLAKDFLALENLIFLVASKSSPFREPLWSDDGQEVVYTVISAFLNVIYTAIFLISIYFINFDLFARRKSEMI